MKRILSVILTLSLILCSCGEVNKPIIKRAVSKSVEKAILIKCFDKNGEQLNDLDVKMEGNESSTVNIDSLKTAISKDTCDIVEAFYWNNGTRNSLAKAPINISNIDKIDLICVNKEHEVKGDTPTPTPSPSPIPIPSKTPQPQETLTPTPEPSPTPEAQIQRHLWWDIGIFVFVTVVFIIRTRTIMARKVPQNLIENGHEVLEAEPRSDESGAEPS